MRTSIARLLPALLLQNLRDHPVCKTKDYFCFIFLKNKSQPDTRATNFSYDTLIT